MINAMNATTQPRTKRRFTWSLSTQARIACTLSLVVTIAVMVGGCDFFDVSNPGPQPDADLNTPDAHQAVVNGMIRAHSDALGSIMQVTGSVTREIFPSGNTGRFGITVNEGRGLLLPDETSGYWNGAQNARWVAEDGIRRFSEVMEESEFQSSELVAQAYLWAGLSNRLLGENFSQAIFDSGEPQPRTAYFERAEQQLTTAMDIAAQAGAPMVQTAARAGRATVRMNLGDWEGAVADAQSIPDGFSFEAPFFGISEDQYNYVYWSSANAPYRAHSVWNTLYESYYEDTGDPRVSWSEDPEFPFGSTARECCGQVPWRFQTKYQSTGDDVDIVDKREMRLIEAESLLRQEQWNDAVSIVNDLRSTVGVDPVSASSLEEAWTLFKRERGIELWLEARRMNDLRRWQENSSPGALYPLEDASNPDSFLDADRDLSFPIPDSERETNPNL